MHGDVSQKDQQSWNQLKNVKVRDCDGAEGAIFFYVDGPRAWSYDDMNVGSEIAIRNPRLHRFMDGQDGMRIDNEGSIAYVRPKCVSDQGRIDYGIINKANGNKKFEKKKYSASLRFWNTHTHKHNTKMKGTMRR